MAIGLVLSRSGEIRIVCTTCQGGSAVPLGLVTQSNNANGRGVGDIQRKNEQLRTDDEIELARSSNKSNAMSC